VLRERREREGDEKKGKGGPSQKSLAPLASHLWHPFTYHIISISKQDFIFLEANVMPRRIIFTNKCSILNSVMLSTRTTSILKHAVLKYY